MASPMVSRVVARGVTGGHHIGRIRVLPQLRDLVSSSSTSSLPGSSAASGCHFSSRTGGSEESQSQSQSQSQAQSQGPNETPSSSSIPTPQVVYKKVSETFRNAASSAGSALHKMREAKLVDSVRTGYTFLKEEMSNTSPRRKPPAEAPVTDAPPENTSVNAIVPVVKKTSGWEKRWETLKEKVRDADAILIVQNRDSSLNHVLIVETDGATYCSSSTGSWNHVKANILLRRSFSFMQFFSPLLRSTSFAFVLFRVSVELDSGD